jgi:hypothetical protein
MPPESWRMLEVALSRSPEAGQEFVDPCVVVLHAEVAGLDAQRLAHREERIEHELLRHHAQLAARLGVLHLHVVPAHDPRNPSWREPGPRGC